MLLRLRRLLLTSKLRQNDISNTLATMSLVILADFTKVISKDTAIIIREWEGHNELQIIF